ncbi:MAG: hypothetical protein ACRBC3_07105 [Burkholderiaceae bacterium]
MRELTPLEALILSEIDENRGFRDLEEFKASMMAKYRLDSDAVSFVHINLSRLMLAIAMVSVEGRGSGYADENQNKKLKPLYDTTEYGKQFIRCCRGPED